MESSFDVGKVVVIDEIDVNDLGGTIFLIAGHESLMGVTSAKHSPVEKKILVLYGEYSLVFHLNHHFNPG